MRTKKAPKVERIDTVTFRPDSRNGSKDFQIPRKLAEDLFGDGLIHGDATNGGYMPRHGQQEFGTDGWRELVWNKRVPDSHANPTTRR